METETRVFLFFWLQLPLSPNPMPGPRRSLPILIQEYSTLSTTLLLPLAAAAAVMMALRLARDVYARWHTASDTALPVPQHNQATLALYAFVAVQGCLFFALAALVMRLKLFAVPILLILASQWAGPLGEQLLGYIKLPRTALFAVVIPVLLAGSAVQGVQNVRRGMSRVGEFNQPQLLEMVEGVRRLGQPSDIYAGEGGGS